MRYVVDADEMRALDAAAIQEKGLPGVVLMENAGRRVADVVLEILAERRAPWESSGASPAGGEGEGEGETVAVICGAGNNGGDGYVIARVLRDHGVGATVYLAAPSERVRGDARVHHDAYCAMGHPIVDISDASSLAANAPALEAADVVVDAVFGTGLTREVEGHFRAVIEAMARNRRGVGVAVDIPSGLSSDTGEVLGVAFAADVTVTMAFLKVGLAIAPGVARAGRVHVAEIGIPTSLARERGVSTVILEPADLAATVPRLGLLDHKNRRGHVLAICGSPGKRGAARLTSFAALRAGAGLVTLAWPWGMGEPEAPDPVMTEAFDMDALASAPDAMRARLVELVGGKHALVVGPGMPTCSGGRALVHLVLAELEIPAVLDADALNHLAQDPPRDLARVKAARAPVVLTPHPGEAGRLLGTSSAAIERDRLGSVRQLAEASGAVVVLKGARTLIACGLAGHERAGRVVINQSGNPGLATAGSGDVLTGIIGALLAQGMDPFDAACLGAHVHGAAGDRAAARLGAAHGVTAGDLAEWVPAVLGELIRVP